MNLLLSLSAMHSLYREDGKWYHHLKGFPGILFDKNGYIKFETKNDYEKHPALQHTQDLHVLNKGISEINGYVSFSDKQKSLLLTLK
ncbi:hypothetical protein IRJ18_15480 [Mucilaginibacter boryungensis]|uniref:Uncharacterized protein n=1 Tax=Mucilaginibacter boryungensis TaxID=768480 RepID=A0ABR9XKK5_9SPHI|nr:hypothetical protein [Mucilaginibacter boryungensis]MBE9667775.1 hypothetical protein [Mucilaginibacter boryungensis]